MGMTPLCELAVKHVTDKFAKHFYTPIYYDLFKDRINETRFVLEIGIGKNKGDIRHHAASLKMWEEFFPKALIYGLDNRRELLINQGRIRSLLADQGDPSSMVRAATYGSFFYDIVIDDGSHKPEHQISSAAVLRHFVAKGGFYIIEDIADDQVFSDLKYLGCERVHANPANFDSVLGIIRC